MHASREPWRMRCPDPSQISPSGAPRVPPPAALRDDRQLLSARRSLGCRTFVKMTAVTHGSDASDEFRLADWPESLRAAFSGTSHCITRSRQPCVR
jgi:hypothetical protein